MGVPTMAHSFTTISDDLFARVKARVTRLRRMTLESLVALCKTYYEDFHPEYMTNKGDTFQYILQHEFGWRTMEAYNDEVTRRENARRLSKARGQLTMAL